MKTILIYFLLFIFWIENSLGIELRGMTGLNMTNLNIYILLIVWAIQILKTRKLIEPNNVNKYLILMILILIASIPIKMMLAEIPNIRVFREVISVKKWANPIILFFILCSIVDNEKTCRAVIFGLIVFLVVTVSSMLLNALGLIHGGAVALGRQGRYAGFSEVNQYASYLVLFIPLLLSPLFFREGFLIKIFSSVMLIIAFAGLIATGSRGGLLSFSFCMLVYLGLLYHQKIFGLRSVILLTFVIFILGGVSYVIAPSEVKQTLSTKLNPASSEDLDQYSSGRTLVWRAGLLLFLDSPIYGHGQNTFMPLVRKRYGISGNSHNDYLLYMVEYGIIGLVVFLMIYYKVFKHVWQHLKTTRDSWRKGLYMAYIAGFGGYTLSMFFVNLFTPRFVFWIYTAIIYRYSQLESNKEK